MSCKSQTHQSQSLNKDYLTIIDRYKKYISSHSFDSDVNNKYAILLREDKIKERVYLSFSYLISDFNKNIPDSFLIYNNTPIFIYTGEQGISHNFNDFYDQFEKYLNADIHKDLSYNNEFHNYISANIDQWMVTGYRSGKLQIRNIPMFPKDNFFEEYTYDDKGFLRYKDGYYHHSMVDLSNLEPEGFDFRSYLKEAAMIPNYIFDDNSVIAILSIDRNGNIQEVKINGLENEKDQEKIINALKNLSVLNPGKIKGKPVPVKVRQLL